MKIAKSQVLSSALLAGVVVASPMLQSCSDEEIAVGAAVVAVGAAISAGSHHGHCSSRERVCSWHTNYWGERVESCRYVTRRYRCDHRRWDFSADASEDVTTSNAELVTFDDLASQPVDQYLDVADLAKHYYLSLESAERFVLALEQARQGHLEAINELGLDGKDMEMLAQLRVPGDESVDRLARNLDQQPLFAKAMLSKIVVHGHKLRKEECARKKAEGVNDRFVDFYCLNNPVD